MADSGHTCIPGLNPLQSNICCFCSQQAVSGTTTFLRQRRSGREPAMFPTHAHTTIRVSHSERAAILPLATANTSHHVLVNIHSCNYTLTSKQRRVFRLSGLISLSKLWPCVLGGRGGVCV